MSFLTLKYEALYFDRQISFHTNHLPPYLGYSSTLSMETARSSETLATVRKTARRHIPEGSTLLFYSHVSL